jgi:phosphohistidine phosphatase SixA
MSTPVLRTSNLIGFGLAALLLVVAALPARAAQLSGAELVAALRQGGYVILMRHASSPNIIPSKTVANPDNTKPERQLDEEGRNSARLMGEAIKTLGIPLGAVLSSPTYRALETIRLAAFSTPATFEQLGDGGSSMSPQAVAEWTSWLKTKTSEQPKAGTNTLIVTHLPNISAAFPDDAKGLKDGEALIFRPDGKGGVELVARVTIGEWPQLAGKS